MLYTHAESKGKIRGSEADRTSRIPVSRRADMVAPYRGDEYLMQHFFSFLDPIPPSLLYLVLACSLSQRFMVSMFHFHCCSPCP